MSDLVLWLTERRNNATAIANTKRGADRDGWLEDADYFNRAIEAVALVTVAPDAKFEDLLLKVASACWMAGSRGQAEDIANTECQALRNHYLQSIIPRGVSRGPNKVSEDYQ